MSQSTDRPKHRRIEIADGICLTVISDGRFKQNSVCVNLLIPLSEQAAANAVAVNLLAKCNARLPDTRQFNNYEAALYDTDVSAWVTSFADAQLLELSVCSVDDRFALENEPVTKQAAELLFDCLLDPYFVESAFDPALVELEKTAQIAKIESELNDKRSYALSKTREILCAGEPYAIYPDGTVEAVKRLNPQTLTAAYHGLIAAARIEIICVGRSDFADVENLSKTRFAGIQRKTAADVSSRFSPLKDKPAAVTESMQIRQAKMVMGYKSGCTDYPALIIFNRIFGGLYTSKLFENVREKLSLCYDVASSYIRYKGVMLVYCGVDEANLVPARDEIQKQLADMCAGDFTDTLLEQAKLSAQNDRLTVTDSLYALSYYYLGRIYSGLSQAESPPELLPPEVTLHEFDDVTRERVVAAAKSFAFDTLYILKGDPNAETGDAQTGGAESDGEESDGEESDNE
jgi:predicted Zn-dependent peptidase